MAGKKQQARPALKNVPKNQRQQQNRRQHQPQAHKERLKDQKPIIQPQPVVQIIPKPKHQQAVYKQAPRAIPKDFVKQQQVANKKTVQKTSSKSFTQRFQREFRDQEFNMEMMEQEQLQARFQRFESEPVRYDLLSQVVEDKRANFKNEQIEYAGGDQQTAVTVTFFNNNITSPEDCDAFIERVYQHENGRFFKCGFDFGTVIQRSEVILDPNYVGRDLVEALYPGRTRYKPQKTTALSKYRTPMEVEQDSVSNKQVTYRIRLPDENHVQKSCANFTLQQKIYQ
ncbi:MAG: hypothetical protein EZS28_040798 [Streblomastix strix]|uniref:Uncharacterized protein n=1 Tax=Streblomastix strix TaxID=222440 RepID=A0A5J4U220_9EUKA|nr:MAG: hypothetical protein EZS28_040798 [Streblomastix strix]